MHLDAHNLITSAKKKKKTVLLYLFIVRLETILQIHCFISISNKLGFIGVFCVYFYDNLLCTKILDIN